MFENFDFGTEVISKYIDFDINPYLPFIEQEFSFKEDMIQITYSGGYILDVGWYPEHSIDGRFVIRIIECYDWLNPKLRFECTDLSTLESYMATSIEFIRISPKFTDEYIEKRHIELYGE